jgi:AcrR family transcriptional regulator
MGSTERRQRHKQELRERILDAARELFNARGYDAVTMREIAARIEYSATALYGHFADKQALIDELCREDFSRLGERFVALAAVADPVERLCRAGVAYVDFAEEHPEHYRLMFMTERPATAPEENERTDPTRNSYVFLRYLIADLIGADRLRPTLTDVDSVAQSAWAAVHGVLALDLTIDRTGPWIDFKPRAERIAACLELLLTGLLRDPDAGRRTLERVLDERAPKSRSTRRSGRPGH